MYISDVHRPPLISRLMAATDGDGGKDPCRRAVNRLAQNPGLHINSHATCHCRHWAINGVHIRTRPVVLEGERLSDI